MSYRLIDSNEIAIKYPEVNEMDCIYVDLPNGLDNEYHYIDAEPTKHYNTESYKMTVTDFPSVEYALITHGRWIKWEGDVLTCSNCKHYWIQSGDQYDFKYCPCCGARMDEVGE